MSFKISNALQLPRDTATWVVSIVAKRGAGKTYSGGVLAEEMLKDRVPIVVIDGMGIWWGLRVGKNGEGPGLPIVVFGGEHADLALDSRKAKEIARAIVEANISAVIDLSAFSKNISRQIVMNFCDELYRINRLERHVIIEEADLWAPQRTIGPDQAQCLGSVDNLVRRGGNHNLGCTLITQRSAVLNKDILTQSDLLIILRTLAPQDKKAIQAWVEEQTDEDRRKLAAWYDSLKSLDNGEAWVWHPEKPAIYKKVKFRERETFHATRKFILSPKAASIKLMDVREFIDRFRDKFEPKPKPNAKGAAQAVRTEVVVPTPRPISSPSPPRFGAPASVPRVGELKAAAAPGAETVALQQSLPDIRLEKLRPTLQVLSEPSTPLGRVLVVLSNSDRHDRWTKKGIKAKVIEHAWEDDGAEDAIDELVRWEILRWQSNGYLRFYPERVQVVDLPTEEIVT